MPISWLTRPSVVLVGHAGLGGRIAPRHLGRQHAVFQLQTGLFPRRMTLRGRRPRLQTGDVVEVRAGFHQANGGLRGPPFGVTLLVRKLSVSVTTPVNRKTMLSRVIGAPSASATATTISEVDAARWFDVVQRAEEEVRDVVIQTT